MVEAAAYWRHEPRVVPIFCLWPVFVVSWLSQPYGDVAVTLARPLHVSKVGQSKEKGKTKQATLKSDFHAYGSEEISLAETPSVLALWRHQRLPPPINPRFTSSLSQFDKTTRPFRFRDEIAPRGALLCWSLPTVDIDGEVLQWGFQSVFEALFLATYGTFTMDKLSIKTLLLWDAVVWHPVNMVCRPDLIIWLYLI